MKVGRISKSGNALVAYIPRDLLAALKLHHRDYITWTLVADALVLRKLTTADAGVTFATDAALTVSARGKRRRA